MKRIPLKVIEVDIGGQKGKLSYQQQALDALKTPPDPNGASYRDMLEAVPLIEKITKAQGESMLLEDAEHQVLVKHLHALRFQFIVPELKTMLEELIDAETPLEAAS